MTKLKRVILINLGGTIVATANTRVDEHYRPSFVPIENVVKKIPELKKVAQVKCIQLKQTFSCDITLTAAHKLARMIQDLVDKPDVTGVVVTQGTDALEEMAYYLNLVIDTTKPIVLTAAMRPNNTLLSDGFRNVFSSVLLAASPKAIGHGALVLMNDTICHARDATKTHVDNLDGFRPLEIGALGYTQGTQVYFYHKHLCRHTCTSEFVISRLPRNNYPKIYTVFGHLGCDNLMIETAIKNGAQGIVSVGMGKGNQSTTLIHSLAKASKQGITVVRCSRINNGLVTREATIDNKHDFIVGNSLSPQKAAILLRLALSVTCDRQQIQRMFDEY